MAIGHHVEFLNRPNFIWRGDLEDRGNHHAKFCWNWPIHRRVIV